MHHSPRRREAREPEYDEEGNVLSEGDYGLVSDGDFCSDEDGAHSSGSGFESDTRIK